MPDDAPPPERLRVRRCLCCGRCSRRLPDLRAALLKQHLSRTHEPVTVRKCKEHLVFALRQNASLAVRFVAITQTTGVFRHDGSEIVLCAHRNRQIALRLPDKRGWCIRVIEQCQLVLCPRHGDVEKPAVFFVLPTLVRRSVCRVRPGREHAVVDIQQIHPFIFQPLA